MKYILPLIIIFYTVFAQSNDGIIRGKVIEKSTNEPIIGANVYIPDTNYGVATHKNGDYIIQNIPYGSYLLKCSFVMHGTQQLQIDLNKNTSPINIDFMMDFPPKIPLCVPDSIQKYHEMISKLSSKEFLEIKIDSISTDYGRIYTSFTNKSQYLIYVIENLQCFNTIDIEVTDKYGKSIFIGLPRVDCDVIGVNYLPQINNMLIIKPYQKIEFPTISIFGRYSISNRLLKNEKYYLRIIYRIKDYQYLPIYHSYSVLDDDILRKYNKAYEDEIYILNRATRGIFSSDKIEIIGK